MEARIQTGALPAVGWSVMFGSSVGMAQEAAGVDLERQNATDV
jgi:hypothetical protein